MSFAVGGRSGVMVFQRQAVRVVRVEHADVAQLVEHHLAKVRVAGSSPVIRSEEPGAPSPSISWWVGREVRHRPAKPFTPVRIRYPPRAIGAAGARFPDTEEVTGSIPVSPTAGPERRSRMLRASHAVILVAGSILQCSSPASLLPRRHRKSGRGRSAAISPAGPGARKPSPGRRPRRRRSPGPRRP